MPSFPSPRRLEKPFVRGAENLAMLRHVVLNVLRLDRTMFGGISKKRKELTWNEDKLFRLLLAA